MVAKIEKADTGASASPRMSTQHTPTEAGAPSQDTRSSPTEKSAMPLEAADNNDQVSQFISRVVAEMSTDQPSTADTGNSPHTTPTTDSVDLPGAPTGDPALPQKANKPLRSFTFPQGIQTRETYMAPAVDISTASAPSTVRESTYSTAIDPKVIGTDPDLKLWLKYTGFYDKAKREKLLSTFRRLAELDEEKRRFEQEKARQQADMEEKHARIMREINGHDISAIYTPSYGIPSLPSSFSTPTADASYAMGTSSLAPIRTQTSILSTAVNHSPPQPGAGTEAFANLDTAASSQTPLMTPVSETNMTGLRSQSKDGIHKLLPPTFIHSQDVSPVMIHEAELATERGVLGSNIHEQAASYESGQGVAGDSPNGHAHQSKVHRGRSPIIKREPNPALFSFESRERSRSPSNQKLAMSPPGAENSLHGSPNGQRSYRERDPSRIRIEEVDFSDPSNVRFFMLKSYNHENINQCMKDGLWSTQVSNGQKLTEASNNGQNVILFFSVNGSRAIQGYALMTDPPSDDLTKPKWMSKVHWKCSPPFRVQWLSQSEIGFWHVGHLKNHLNEGKPVHVAKDGQEIPVGLGQKMMDILQDVEARVNAGLEVATEPPFYRNSVKNGTSPRAFSTDVRKPIPKGKFKPKAAKPYSNARTAWPLKTTQATDNAHCYGGAAAGAAQS